MNFSVVITRDSPFTARFPRHLLMEFFRRPVIYWLGFLPVRKDGVIHWRWAKSRRRATCPGLHRDFSSPRRRSFPRVVRWWAVIRTSIVRTAVGRRGILMGGIGRRCRWRSRLIVVRLMMIHGCWRWSHHSPVHTHGTLRVIHASTVRVGAVGPTRCTVEFLNGISIAGCVRRGRRVVRHGRPCEVVLVVHGGTLDGGGRLLVIVARPLVVEFWWRMANVGRIRTTRLGRRPLHVSMLVGMGTHLLLDVLWPNAFSFLLLSVSATGVFSG